jgi:hypothetical protein
MLLQFPLQWGVWGIHGLYRVFEENGPNNLTARYCTPHSNLVIIMSCMRIFRHHIRVLWEFTWHVRWNHDSFEGKVTSILLGSSSIFVSPLTLTMSCFTVRYLGPVHTLTFYVSKICTFTGEKVSQIVCSLDFLRLPCSWSRDSSVGIATRYGLNDRNVGVRVPAGSKMFSSPQRPDRLWGPPSLLSNGYRG